MMDINSTQALEWNSILRELSRRATSELGKELCFNFPFASTLQEAIKIQNQTTEALLLIDKEGSIPLGGLRNIKRPLDELSRGFVLTGITFLDISSTLKSIRVLKKFITAKLPETSELYGLVFHFIPTIL
jgi:DNA mismatch repair protein MutS2